MSNIVESKKFVWSEVGKDDKGNPINHNKWWQVILYDNDDVMTKWARVGKVPQSKLFSGVGKSFLEEKINEKLKRGYTEAQTIDPLADVQPATAPIAKGSLKEIARSQILKTSGHPVLDRLIDRLVQSNVHKITSNTQLRLNDATGLFQTPLGVGECSPTLKG